MQAPYSRTMFDLLCEQAERYADRVAVICDDKRITYCDLHDRAARVAAGLRGLGLVRHDRVGLLLNNRTEWLEICFGAAAIGAVLVPFSTWSKRRELEFLLRRAGEGGFGRVRPPRILRRSPTPPLVPLLERLQESRFAGGGPAP